jgi:phosphoserine phosphatase
MNILKIIVTVFLYTSLFPSCNRNKTEVDPLPSWNEGKNKTDIIDYVNTVTNAKSIHYISIPNRIATFDNDGTLWSEQPLYFQLFFAFDRIKEMAPQHPEWKKIQPYKAILENNLAEFLKEGEEGILKIILKSHTGNRTDAFEKSVKKWLATAKHPTKNVAYTALVYQPMLELISYLQQHHFKTYIVSGGGTEFMRPWVETVYGIPKEQVIGSTIKTTYEYNKGKPIIKRKADIEFVNDKKGKPEAIHKFIGRKPVFAVGNSDGDLEMLRWTASNAKKPFMLYIHHTDETREWAYDRASHIGKFDLGLDEALEKGWKIVDMKDDWKKIYPHE